MVKCMNGRLVSRKKCCALISVLYSGMVEEHNNVCVSRVVWCMLGNKSAIIKKQHICNTQGRQKATQRKQHDGPKVHGVSPIGTEDGALSIARFWSSSSSLIVRWVMRRSFTLPHPLLISSLSPLSLFLSLSLFQSLTSCTSTPLNCSYLSSFFLFCVLLCRTFLLFP